MNVRPLQGEYAPYYEAYVRLVPDGNIMDVLSGQMQNAADFFAAIPEKRALFRYAPGKWSMKEVLGHITDTERIMSGRLLRIARGDQTPLPGYDENEYIKGAAFDSIPLGELVEDFTAVRRATLTLLRGLPEEAWLRRGTANNSELSARALAYITAGHELHHRNIVQERYLV